MAKKKIAEDGTEPEVLDVVETRATPGAQRLAEMKASPSGLQDRDAVLAAVVDAVIELGGGGAATVDPATSIEKNN